jgi:hypothetical protein
MRWYALSQKGAEDTEAFAASIIKVDEMIEAASSSENSVQF